MISKITDLQQIDLKSGQITNMRWSPNGRLLAVPTESGTIVVYDPATGEVVRTIGPHAGCVTAVAWDLKAECILTGSLDLSISLWEVKSGTRAEFTIAGHTSPVHSIEWTDEEAFAITCSLDHLRVLDGSCLLSGWSKEMEDSVNQPGEFTAASCSRQSTFLLGMGTHKGRRLRLVSLLSGAVLSSIAVASSVRSLAWSPVEDLLAAGCDHGILLCRCTQDGFEGRPYQLDSTSSQVRALSFSGDGTLLAACDDQGLKIWNVRARKLIATVQNPEPFSLTRPASGIAFHPAKPVIAITHTKTAVRLLDVNGLLDA